MPTMFPGKRQWQRVVDAAACEKRQREEEEEDIVITDKTRLLPSESSEHPSFDENFSYARTNVQGDQSLDNELPLQSPWKHDSASIEPRFDIASMEPPFSSVDLNNFDHLKHAHIAESDRTSYPIRKSCSHASWQGFKQLVKKQFMPPFPFKKDMLQQEMSHLQQRRMEGAMNRASRVLGASTNLVELRKLDAKIQNGMNKSAFVASSKGGKSKENLAWDHNQNLEISKAVKLSSLSETSLNAGINNEVIKMKPSRNGVTSSSLMKENGILRKLKRQAKKNDVLLLANARD